jgi:hypothetical protein
MKTLLLTALLATPLFNLPPNTSESQWKHLTTGAAIGTGATGFCLAAMRHLSGEDKLGACLAAVLTTTAAAYLYKEQRDKVIYSQRSIDGRDVLEGIGGAALGAAIFIPLVAW